MPPSFGETRSEGIGCASIPDLFHAMRDISKQMGAALGLAQIDQQLNQAQEKLKRLQSQGKETLTQHEWIEQPAMRTLLQSGQDTYHSILQQMSRVFIPLLLTALASKPLLRCPAALNQQLRNSKRCSTYKLPND